MPFLDPDIQAKTRRVPLWVPVVLAILAPVALFLLTWNEPEITSFFKKGFWSLQVPQGPSSGPAPLPPSTVSGTSQYRVTPAEIAAWKASLPTLLFQEKHLRRSLRPKNFEDHVELVMTRQQYLLNKRLAETGGKNRKPGPDPVLRRLLTQVREYARTDEERKLAEQMTRGEAGYF